MDDWFSSKCSAAGIIPVVHANVSDESERATLRQSFMNVAKDEVPMVRKYIYDHLGALCVDAGVAVVRNELIEVLKALLEETQENIRMITVDVALKVTQTCKNHAEEFKEIAHPLIDNIGNDASWRVRKNFAKAIGDIAIAMSSKEMAGQTLIPFYQDLLKDPETEVRLAAVRSLPALTKTIDQASFDSGIATVLEGILSDSAQSPKTAFSEVILELAPHVSKATAAKTIVPIILRLLESDVADMRSSVLEKLPSLADAIGVAEVVAQFLPKLLLMYKDPKWRVRKLVLEHTTQFAQTVGEEAFLSTFKPILFEALHDSVFGVREAAAKQFPPLINSMGFDWVVKNILTEALNTKAIPSKNYQYRMVPLLVCFELSTQPADIPMDYITTVVGPLVIDFSKDPVVNVRNFTVKTLGVLAKKADAGYVDSAIKPSLMSLTQDSDSEVKLSAVRVLKGL
jgi:serine/threonine-protein phosphatase 2A regulatory subunit A